MKQLVGFLVVFGDVGILVQAKHFWVGCDREVPEIFNIGLERKSSVDISSGSLGSHRSPKVLPEQTHAGITLFR